MFSRCADISVICERDLRWSWCRSDAFYRDPIVRVRGTVLRLCLFACRKRWLYMGIKLKLKARVDRSASIRGAFWNGLKWAQEVRIWLRNEWDMSRSLFNLCSQRCADMSVICERDLMILVSFCGFVPADRIVRKRGTVYLPLCCRKKLIVYGE